ncbi:MAG: hypothetical protein NC818_07435 [Candidatus Omnitrophica bacterium]|nr:hypothetical protein [Candidatus Omnitrophota bacterium]
MESLSVRGAEVIEIEGSVARTAQGITEADVEEVNSAYWTYVQEHLGKIPSYGAIAQILKWPVARLAKNMIRINKILQSKAKPPLYFEKNWPENFANAQGVLYAYEYYKIVSGGKNPSAKDLVLMTGYPERAIGIVIDIINTQRKKYNLPPLELRKED